MIHQYEHKEQQWFVSYSCLPQRNNRTSRFDYHNHRRSYLHQQWWFLADEYLNHSWNSDSWRKWENRDGEWLASPDLKKYCSATQYEYPWVWTRRIVLRTLTGYVQWSPWLSCSYGSLLAASRLHWQSFLLSSFGVIKAFHLLFMKELSLHRIQEREGKLHGQWVPFHIYITTLSIHTIQPDWLFISHTPFNSNQFHFYSHSIEWKTHLPVFIHSSAALFPAP